MRWPKLQLATLVILLSSSPILARTTIEDNLKLGIPREPAIAQEVLIERNQYALLYSDYLKEPVWVSWHLDFEDLGEVDRCNCFGPDPALPAMMIPLRGTEYKGSGYDRGHMCPSADRTATKEDNRATFYMTNIIPQNPKNNQGLWADFENYVRRIVRNGYEVYQISGIIGIKSWIGSHEVAIPSRLFKVVLALPVGDNDIERINAGMANIISIDVPNDDSVGGKTWSYYSTPINKIEADFRLKFFSNTNLN